MRETDNLYLAIIDNPKTNVGYKISRLGMNSLNTIVKAMVKNSP